MDLNNMPPSPLLRVPGWIRFPLTLASIVLAFVTMFANVGPYRWITSTQNDVLGHHYMMLSGLLTVLVFLIPVLVILGLIAVAMPNRDPNRPSRFLTTPEERRVMHQAQRVKSQAFERWLHQNRLLFGGAILSVGLVCTGTYFMASSIRGELVVCTVAEFNEGNRPPSRYVQITEARLLWHDVRQIVRTTNNIESEHFYVPMVEATWVPGTPYEAFAHFTEVSYQSALSAGSPPIRGTVARGLPDLTDSTLRNRGMLGGPGWVVNHGQTTDELRMVGTVMLTMGSVVGLPCLFFGMLQYRRRRRNLGSS